MPFIRVGFKIKDEALGLQLKIASGPEHALWLELIPLTCFKASAGQNNELWRADVSYSLQGDLLRVTIGERYAGTPDQRLVDLTGLTASGDMARVLLAALTGAALYDWRSVDRRASIVRIEAAPRLYAYLRPALSDDPVPRRVFITERAIEQMPATSRLRTC